MRAKFISEKFSEEGDPIHDMGIGVLEAPRNLSELKKLPYEELNKLYELIKKFGDNARIQAGDDLYSEMGVWDRRFFRNNIIKALNYRHKIDLRDESRSINLKPGDGIKTEIKGNIYKGYPMFSKRGIIKTDSHGRIQAETLRGIMRVPARFVEKLTPKEQKEFDKEFFIARKDKLKKLLS